LLVGVALLCLAGAGCGSTQWVSVRSTPYSPLVERLKLTSWHGPQPSDRTVQVLRRYALAEKYHSDPETVVGQLQVLVEQEPSPDKLYSFAELAYLEGKKREVTDPRAAMEMFERSVVHAYRYLFDRRYGDWLNPYDPQFRGACDLYNGALESALRIARKNGTLLPGSTHQVPGGNHTLEITVVARNVRWHPEDFERFEFVSDYEIRGLSNQYHTYGLGVPLIAVRKVHPEQAASERYYPPGLSFPVTAFLRLMPSEPGQTAVRHALLELYDPLEAADALVAGVRVPLESDLTTPLAYFLNQGPSPSLVATFGLLRPDKSQDMTGLYMTQPYDPGKIPVLFVHGLWSEPTTWTDMFNDLRSSPEIRQNYQFWFYLYPTGQPFWISAAQMREDLAELRQTLDPARRQAALDRMVLVGHSMGGLVSKLQTVASGDEYWRAVSDQPFHLVKAGPEVRRELEKTFFFGPNPSIRRVITIGSPHRGSEFANRYTRFLGSKFIFLPQLILHGSQELFRDNPGLFREGPSIAMRTSIDSLAPDSPLLPVLYSAPRPPWVRYHTIAGVTGLDASAGIPEDGGDGVVSYASARLESATSELVVDADHLNVHRHPLTVLEVRRILLEHLAQLHDGSRVIHAAGPR
jgi:pimeloyl-ACP methyl ester carboxylesterase